ncbi:unnamed protein product [Musa acuminata subsp. malaccensis]|uniref:(wild Malaysian banana) hypothetical protein n=1 Tax=Musa acuminata subsp. malaccensis TaxID=214687 RepID=A0A804KIB8_MUSAM|nr:PREDICTED: uncharacterized protein LOC103997784 [Musa acuminata subsp. malaccensis]CAG1834848.1 unnamed protein product [Musa acuminata subsp. malaccensis]
MPAYREEAIGDSDDENYASTNSDSPVEKEKQITVDPLSLKQLADVRGNRISDGGSAASEVKFLPPPVLVRPKLVSCSLPSSALSSPKKWNYLDDQEPPVPARFAWADQKASLRRSKSCGEGRSSSPSVEFIDILSRRPSIHQPDDGVHVVDHDTSDDDSKEETPQPVHAQLEDDQFKCWCLFLPGLSHRKKQVILQQASQAQSGHLQLRKVVPQGFQDARESAAKGRISTVSKAASLEKFSCGSWSSSALLGIDGDDDGGHSYFDLPLELIKSCHDDADSPVRTAFVFDKDLKGVLKKSTSNLASRKSHASSSNRHVRFSTSAPTSYPASPSSTCITPRLRRAREEFNALLAAQNAA